MKKIVFVAVLSTSLLFGFDFGSFAKSVLGNETPSTSTTKSSNASLSNTTVTNGLKEALRSGVTYAVKSLGHDNGYLDNALVKIALPDNLKKAEGVVRKFGGDKVADDLIKSMNAAASKAAPKTADIFIRAIDKMTLKDAQAILAGNKDAATQYFKTHTEGALKKMILPIVKESMQENRVAKYYNAFNSLYRTYGKKYVENSSVVSFAKKFGADSYLPSSSDQNLDAYVTQKAIDGLFVMIAQKEIKIRENPIEQTTALLKQVFGQKKE